MKRYKKRTLALVLASALTVVGAFGADYYNNSLMSMKFVQGTYGSTRVVLYTQKPFNNSELHIVQSGANTYVITLNNTNNEAPSHYDDNPNITSVSVATHPYTKNSEGYTKITLKTANDTKIQVKTALYIPDKHGEQAKLTTDSKQAIQYGSNQGSATNNNTAANNYNSSASQNSNYSNSQTSSMQQEQKSDSTQVSQSLQDRPVKRTMTLNEVEQSGADRTQEILGWLLGLILVVCASVGIIIVGKEKMADVIGEQEKLDLDDIKDEKPQAKKNIKNINTTIKKLDKKYPKQYSMPTSTSYGANNSPYSNDEEATVTPADTGSEDDNMLTVENIIDLDALLQEQSSQNNASVPTVEDESEDNLSEENLALEEFLNAYGFENDDNSETQSTSEELEQQFDNDAEKVLTEAESVEKDDEETLPEVNQQREHLGKRLSIQESAQDTAQDEQEQPFDEEFYNKCINNEKMQFSKDDIYKINLLLSSEISDEAIKNISVYASMPKKEIKKVSIPERLENLITNYTIKQNIYFTQDDVAALDKIVKVEIDSNFLKDIKTNPERMREMQREIAMQSARPHKTSEILTLNVKDVLPDLSKALLAQGGKYIETEVKPQVVYYSEGYDVSTFKPDVDLPDLTVEINNQEAYATRPSDEFLIVDNSYENETIEVHTELPDLQDVLNNPEKYIEVKEKVEIASEEQMLERLTNVQFKPFDDGINSFDAVNQESNKVKTIKNNVQKVAQNNYQENKAIEQILKNNDTKEHSTKSPDRSEVKNTKSDSSSDVVKLLNSLKQERENRINNKKTEQVGVNKIVQFVPKEKKTEVREVNQPEICEFGGKSYKIISTVNLTDTAKCYLARCDNKYYVLGITNEKQLELKQYNEMRSTKFQTRISEKLEDGTLQCIVKIGIHKFILNVKDNNMEFVMDLC